jgi:uncharacterized protein
MSNGLERRPRLPELLLGLLAVAAALAVTGIVVANAVRDVKRARDTIDVTGSARQPITADVVHWSLAVSAEAPRPQDAVRLLRTRAAAVRTYLRKAGLRGSAVTEPPVATQQVFLRVGSRRRVPGFRLVQRFRISSTEVAKVESVAARATDLLAQGIPISASGLIYISANLAFARIEALKKAIADAHRRAETIVTGIGGKLGSVKSARVGVYQVVARNSTAISDYGINDTTSREKDVYAVVGVTFRLH